MAVSHRRCVSKNFFEGVKGEGGELGSPRMAYQTPKGRDIPWDALYDNSLRELSHRTVTDGVPLTCLEAA